MGDSKNYLMPDSVIRVEFYETEPVGIELPPTVDLVVKETVPGIKGATASAQVKPATLETGFVVQVPPFVNEGDKIRVNTETGEYQAARLTAHPAIHDQPWKSSARQPPHGWIEVITGSMFSGKSEELIRRLRRAQIARQKVQIFKPVLDDRYSERHIVSHSDMRIESQNVENSDDAADGRARRHARSSASTKGSSSTRISRQRADTLANRGKRVIVAGLDQDYLGRPFEPMPQLLAIAEYITKTLAICVVCGDPANHTQRLVSSSDRVLVGATGLYEARCRHCFDPGAGRRRK